MLPPARRLKVVVVDDDSRHNLLLGAILQQAGYEVALCVSGPAALAAAVRGCDCLITDYHMPGMDGVELVRAVRRVHSPVCILLTGNDDGAVDERALASGAVAVLRKPTHPVVILGILNMLASGTCRRRPGTDRLASGAHALARRC